MSKGQWWTLAEDEIILRLRDIERLSWVEIAALCPGRTAAACEQRYYGKLKGARNRTPRRRGPEPSVPAVSWRKRGACIAGVAAAPAAPAVVAPAPPVPAVAPRARMRSLDGLREQAEMQLRIAERGLTAGFFNDPPPGRSALDERARAPAPVAGRPVSVAVSDG